MEAKNHFDAIAKRSEEADEAGSRDRRRYKTNAVARWSLRRVGADREPVLISDDAPVEAGQGSITKDETDREEDTKVVEDDVWEGMDSVRKSTILKQIEGETEVKARDLGIDKTVGFCLGTRGERKQRDLYEYIEVSS